MSRKSALEAIGLKVNVNKATRRLEESASAGRSGSRSVGLLNYVMQWHYKKSGKGSKFFCAEHIATVIRICTYDMIQNFKKSINIPLVWGSDGGCDHAASARFTKACGA